MATPAQILANRQNALKSTGPRSVEGKAVSRFNALKTGIDAKAQVIPGENPGELEALIAAYDQQFQPCDPLERFLVDSMVNAEWQLRRLRKVETSLWDREISGPKGVLGILDSPAFTRLQRRIDAAERSYHRALKELQRVRKAAAVQTPAGDPEIGFVPLDANLEHDTVAPGHAAQAPALASFASNPKPSASPAAPSTRRPTHENLALRL